MCARLLSNFIWEGLSTESKPTHEFGALDGHIFKELDSGITYIRVNGVWNFLDEGLSCIKATKSGKILTNSSGFYHVIFLTPCINDYSVSLSVEDRVFGNRFGAIAYFKNLLNNGFDIQTRDIKNGNPYGGITVGWLATMNHNH